MGWWGYFFVRNRKRTAARRREVVRRAQAGARAQRNCRRRTRQRWWGYARSKQFCLVHCDRMCSI
eukprot:5349660-Pyramimonas_sp.AAC.1